MDIRGAQFQTGWLDDYRKQAISRHDTTTELGCRQAATELRVTAVRCLLGRGRLQHLAVNELARSFELLGESYRDESGKVRVEAGRHLARARKFAEAS